MRKKTWRLRCVRRSNVLTELIRRHSFLFLRPCEFRSRWKKREREISSIFDPLFPQSTLSLLFKHVLLMHRAYCLLPCLSTHSISYIYIYIFIVDQETDQSHRSNRYLKRILLYNSIRSIIRSPWIFLNSSQIRDERKGGKEESLTGWDGAKAYSSLSIILPNDHWIEFRFSSQFSRTSKR